MATTAVTASSGAAAIGGPPMAVPPEEENKQDPSIGNCWGMTDERTLWTRIWQVVAGASLVVNLVAMAITGAVAHVLVAGIVACVVAPVVFYLQFKLEDTETMRTVQNQLRQQVNRLHIENNKLSVEVTRLQTQTERLAEEEAKLEQIVKEQGSNVASFMGLVDENAKTVKELKALVKADLTQTVVTAIIASDFDSSGTFSDQEIQILELRMKNVPGVNVRHDLLVKAASGSDRSMSNVLRLLDDIDREDLADSDRIFQFDETHLARHESDAKKK